MQIPEPQPEHNPRPPWLVPAVTGVLALGLIAIVVSRFARGPAESQAPKANTASALASSPTPPRSLPPGLREGRDLALKVCVSCHLFPEPALLDRVTWAMEVLPDMERWLGMRIADEDSYAALGLDQRVRAARVIPDQPPITVDQWRAICSYYLHEAPDEPLPQAEHPPVRFGLEGFKVEVPKRTGIARTTLVHIDPEQRRIYLGSIGEQFTGALSIFSGAGVHERSMRLSSPPVALTILPNHVIATLIGPYGPSDELLGKVVSIPRPDTPATAGADLLTGLPRTTQSFFADLNGDGRQDIVVCGYGHVLGKLSWFENKGEGRYEEQVLLDQGGVLQARALDWNRDGRLDLIVMTAQQREGVYLMTNLGDGDFEPRPLIEKPPAWGFASFGLADMNGDGHPDLLTANGDNGDFTGHKPPLKGYHGHRIHLNDGSFHFAEAWTFPVNGAFKILARDFDRDGDMDLATTSFYADYEHTPEEGFILFENTGGPELNFNPRTFPEVGAGRWITLDAGDLDADGDIDIVLGSLTPGPDTAPIATLKRWRDSSPPFVILRNLSSP